MYKYINQLWESFENLKRPRNITHLKITLEVIRVVAILITSKKVTNKKWPIYDNSSSYIIYAFVNLVPRP